MSYAKKECSRCHVVLPANQMRKRSKAVTSTTTSRRLNNDTYGRHTRVSETSRRVSIWYCPECLSVRRKANLIVCLGIIVLAAAAFAYISHADRSNSLSRMGGDVSTEGPSAATSIAGDSELSTQIGANFLASDPEADPLQEDSADLPPLEEQAPADDQHGSYYAPFIERALFSGQTSTWELDGRTGTVILNDAPPSVDGPCRSATVMRDEPGGMLPVERSIWCRTADFSWRAQ